jgi:hypothetical protein
MAALEKCHYSLFKSILRRLFLCVIKLVWLPL